LKGLAAAAVMLAAVAMAVFALAPDSARARDLDCADFANQAEAEEDLAGGDPDGLDADNDGIACEDLPCPCSYSPTSGTGTTPGPAPSTPPPPPAYHLPKSAARTASTRLIRRIVARSARLDSAGFTNCRRLAERRIDCRLFALGRSLTQKVACQYKVAVGARDRHPVARLANHRCHTKALLRLSAEQARQAMLLAGEEAAGKRVGVELFRNSPVEFEGWAEWIRPTPDTRSEECALPILVRLQPSRELLVEKSPIECRPV
jgi:hypothetical protein